MKNEVYDIAGMHCAACSGAVERVTRKLPGVTQSDVNLPLNRLTITYDEELCTPAMIEKKIEKAGFGAKPHQQSEAKITATEDDSKELQREKTALIGEISFAALLLFFSMGHMLFPSLPLPAVISPGVHPGNFALLQLLLAMPVLFLGGHFFRDGFLSLIHANPNMDTLVALSAAASFIYSVVMTFLIAYAPHHVHDLYYESAAVVVALVSVGKYLEARNKEKTKSAITKLMELAPDTALLIDENGEWEVPTSFVKIGDTLLVKPGNRVPLDGTVIKGSGSVNEAMLTGESMPITKCEGSEVIGGSIAVNGALYIKVTRIGEDTTLAKIIRFVEDAQGKKAPISKTADKVAGVFVPIVIAIALIAAVIWLLTGASVGFAVKIFTAVLVIACPCAMGLATPTAIIVGTGLGASRGILIRSGEALETTNHVSVAIFDKTGTVTLGKPMVTDIATADEEALFAVAVALEKLSDHPLSKAICEAAPKPEGKIPATVSAFREISGRGLAAKDEANNSLFCGNTTLMTENGISLKEYETDLRSMQEEGKTIVCVAVEKRLLGLVAIADEIKADAADAIANLKKRRVKTVLLTGDHRASATYIGKKAGFDHIVAEVLPREKAEVVRSYQNQNDVVMMVGDGINDAPALVQADVGCAIGSGSDIAIDAADIVLMRQELTDVSRALHLSRLTIRNIRQNLFWAFCYNTLCIPIAAGALYPSLHLLLSPMIGALAMSLSSLFVVANALRLKGKKI